MAEYCKHGRAVSGYESPASRCPQCFKELETRIADLEEELKNGDYWRERAKEFYSNGGCPVCFGTDEGDHTSSCPWGDAVKLLARMMREHGPGCCCGLCAFARQMGIEAEDYGTVGPPIRSGVYAEMAGIRNYLIAIGESARLDKPGQSAIGVLIGLCEEFRKGAMETK